LLLNFPLPNSGMLDDRELAVLDGITKWMAVNSEAIYSSRPVENIWRGAEHGVCSRGAGRRGETAPAPRRRLRVQRKKIGRISPEADVRFTTKGGGALYAFVRRRAESRWR